MTTYTYLYMYLSMHMYIVYTYTHVNMYMCYDGTWAHRASKENKTMTPHLSFLAACTTWFVLKQDVSNYQQCIPVLVT